CCVCTRQVTAQLSERAGLLTGTWFSYFTGSLVAVAAVMLSPALGAGADFSLAFAAPCWAYLGGALGAAAVYLQNLCVKRMSSVAMTLVMFAGQVFGGAAIDAAFYGEFSARTLAGGALAFAGLVLNALAARRVTRRT
ncbi:MAG TPA: DMT family transporter, partial [Candidatus Scatomorpha stercoravium]|nr:DMT family transporter [Candidatus Scatomorpha stercoravium]